MGYRPRSGLQENELWAGEDSRAFPMQMKIVRQTKDWNAYGVTGKILH
ncbi:hypothetical protein HGH92_20800 [Chitinophaga varians]|uniref:Uncharacterized protein n=1 Tax=Chitinophaga varians TaxID=2202339 RepID=A0A847S5B2_9BACT|nr:hypothetical protein [Chitinophaga varians]